MAISVANRDLSIPPAQPFWELQGAAPGARENATVSVPEGTSIMAFGAARSGVESDHSDLGGGRLGKEPASTNRLHSVAEALRARVAGVR